LVCPDGSGFEPPSPDDANSDTPAFSSTPKILWKAWRSVAVVWYSEPPKLIDTMFRFWTPARSAESRVSPATISTSLRSGML
jgi:hypothetical protein